MALSKITNASLSTGIDSAKIGAGDVSNTEHAFLNSISSNVQTQIAGAGNPVHYFDVHLNSNLSLSDSADTKVTGWTENEDSSSWFASDRFTPQLAGRYYIMASAELGTGSGSSLWHNGNCSVKRNGTAVTLPTFNSYASYAGQQKTHTASVIVNMNGSSDYVEMYVNLNVTSGSPVCVGTTTGNTRFCGFYIGA